MIFTMLVAGRDDADISRINKAFDRACTRRLTSTHAYSGLRRVATRFGQAFPAGLPHIPWEPVHSNVDESTHVGVTILKVDDNTVVMIGVNEMDVAADIWIHRRPTPEQQRRQMLTRVICRLHIDRSGHWRVITASELVVTRALNLPTLIADGELRTSEAPITTVGDIEQLIEALAPIDA